MAILIDGGQSAKVASFSRKIQIKSVLEIRFWSTTIPLKDAETLNGDAKQHNRDRDLT